MDLINRERDIYYGLAQLSKELMIVDGDFVCDIMRHRFSAGGRMPSDFLGS